MKNKYIVLLIVLIGFSQFLHANVVLANDDESWMEPSMHHRFLFSINTGDANRVDHPVEFDIDLNSIDGNIENNSFRLYQEGIKIIVEVIPLGSKKYTLIFQIEGNFSKNFEIKYILYFDILENGIKNVDVLEKHYEMQDHYFPRYGRNPVHDTLLESDNYSFSLLRDYWVGQHGEWYKFNDFVFGDVKARLFKEKTVWNGTTWMYQTIENTIYRKGLKIDSTFKNNVSTDAYAHAVFNFSRGNAGLDVGLHVIAEQDSIRIHDLDWESAFVLSNETTHLYDCANRTWGVNESLRVIPVVYNTSYIIMYDEDQENGQPREDWYALGLRTGEREKTAFSNVLIEYWKNTTENGAVSNYFVNVSLNTAWWWGDKYFGIDDHDGEPMHGFQENGTYRLGLSWFNGNESANFKELIENQIQDMTIPVNITMHGFELPESISIDVRRLSIIENRAYIDVSITGDTIYKVYYAVNNLTNLHDYSKFSNGTIISESSIVDSAGKNCYVLYIVVVDTNGTMVYQSSRISVEKDEQGILFSDIFYLIILAIVIIIPSLLAIVNRKKSRK